MGPSPVGKHCTQVRFRERDFLVGLQVRVAVLGWLQGAGEQAMDVPQEDVLFNVRDPGFPRHQWESGASWGQTSGGILEGRAAPTGRVSATIYISAQGG